MKLKPVKDLLTISQGARQIGIAPSILRGALRRRELPALQFSKNSWRIREKDLIAWFESKIRHAAN
jgi:hypothetical protein